MTKFSDLAAGERFKFVCDREPRCYGVIPVDFTYCVKAGPHTFTVHYTESDEVIEYGRVGVGDNPVYRVQALAEHEP